MAKSKMKMTITGHDELLKQIESLGKEMPKVIEKAVEDSAKVATEEYQKVVEHHRYSGLTEETIVKEFKAKNEGRKIVLNTGFDIHKGGLAAIFLDRGTPIQKPINFVAKIKRNKRVKGALEKVLEKEVG